MNDSSVFDGIELFDAVPKRVIQFLVDFVGSPKTVNEKAKKPDKLHGIFIFINYTDCSTSSVKYECWSRIGKAFEECINEIDQTVPFEREGNRSIIL